MASLDVRTPGTLLSPQLQLEGVIENLNQLCVAATEATPQYNGLDLQVVLSRIRDVLNVHHKVLNSQKDNMGLIIRYREVHAAFVKYQDALKPPPKARRSHRMKTYGEEYTDPVFEQAEIVDIEYKELQRDVRGLAILVIRAAAELLELMGANSVFVRKKLPTRQ
ncbi:hypothetical protein NLJ89_g3483 [Agrocybe chaxingu]|uniref:Uncharacterized protein n=1 Tax=Agrocybe chaxingu TaxID=84603 RepID=A0A9W8MXB3_9AGAR|nr:hypothetical protein NLJ89_g3483 [Agrocybe chaxingu]